MTLTVVQGISQIKNGGRMFYSSIILIILMIKQVHLACSQTNKIYDFRNNERNNFGPSMQPCKIPVLNPSLLKNLHSNLYCMIVIETIIKRTVSEIN